MRFSPTLALFAMISLAACSSEHDPAVMSVSASDCNVCHNPEYQAATLPPHVGIFPNECALCHTNDAWQPAIFEHESVANRECVLCHQANYDGTTMPSHAGLYPTTCDDCHGTVSWIPAIGGAHPESAFPLANGAHQGITCAQCHDPTRGSSAMGENTDCVGCHTGEHSLGQMNDKHKEVNFYTEYRDVDDPGDVLSGGPAFCLLCHPNGRN